MSIMSPRMVCSPDVLFDGVGENYSARKPVSIYNRGRAEPDTTTMSVRKLLDLSGKIALVTGGSRGLGLQIAEALGEMGAKLAITARKADELEQAREHLARQRIEATTLVCDISRPETIEPMVSKLLDRFGRVDILVNNAGATWGAPAEDHPLEACRNLCNRNLTD